MELRGEVITTPFSYVATTSSLVWQKCTPVFVDVLEDDLNIDPERIESSITSETTGILATHVYGNPCDTAAIEEIAAKHGLKVLYDCAHGFAVDYLGRSLCTYGDASILSFHATKIFHTVEGGAICSADEDFLFKATYMRNFGHDGQEAFHGLGINGKMSELHAAMGLCMLPRIDGIIASRKMLCERYDELFDMRNDHGIRRPIARSGTNTNYAYYPIVLNDVDSVERTLNDLRKQDVSPRRYFYPSLADLPYVRSDAAPIARSASERVLCLPLYPDLPLETVEMIARTVIDSNIH